jgi:hypothetical protein
MLIYLYTEVIMDITEGKAMTMEEATQKYPRQWLGVKVLDRDKESGQPLKVEVLYSDVDLTGIDKIGLDDFCTIYTGPIPEVDHLLLL